MIICLYDQPRDLGEKRNDDLNTDLFLRFVGT